MLATSRAQSVVDTLGVQAFAASGDITMADAPEEVVRRTIERFGRVDILVNNAALAHSTRFPDLTLDEWRATIEVNLTAPFRLIKAVLPTMKTQGYGRIVNISSSAGRFTIQTRARTLHRVKGGCSASLGRRRKNSGATASPSTPCARE